MKKFELTKKTVQQSNSPTRKIECNSMLDIKIKKVYNIDKVQKRVLDAVGRCWILLDAVGRTNYLVDIFLKSVQHVQQNYSPSNRKSY